MLAFFLLWKAFFFLTRASVLYAIEEKSKKNTAQHKFGIVATITYAGERHDVRKFELSRLTKIKQIKKLSHN